MLKLLSTIALATTQAADIFAIDYKFSGPTKFGNIVRIQVDRSNQVCSDGASDEDTIVCNIFDSEDPVGFEPKDNANRQGGLAYDYDNELLYWTAKCIDGGVCTQNDFYLLSSPLPAAGTVDPVCSPTIVDTGGFELKAGGSLAFHQGNIFFLAQLPGAADGAPFQLVALDTTTNMVVQACGDAQVKGDTVEIDASGKAWIFDQGGSDQIKVYDLAAEDCGAVGNTAPWEFSLISDDDFSTQPTLSNAKLSLAFARDLDANDCCNWDSEGLCANGCADIGSGCDYGLYVVDRANAKLGFINHAQIDLSDPELDDELFITSVCGGAEFTREDGELFDITDTARTEQIFFFTPDECGEDEFDFDVLGHSGKINIQNGEDKAQITMDFLWERDEDDNKINDPSHAINSFANQEFYWFDSETTSLIEADDSSRIRFFSCLHGEHDRKTSDLDSKNLNSPQLNEQEMEDFCNDNHDTTAYIAVDIYRFETCVDPCAEGELGGSDVAQGTLKWSVLVRNYQYCNVDSEGCKAKGKQVVAKFLEFGFEFKADFVADGDALGGGLNLDLGAGWEMMLDDEVQVNGATVATNLDDFMEITSNDNKVLFKIRVEIPSDQETVDVTYDPFLKQSKRTREGQWEFSAQPSSDTSEASSFPVVAATVGSLAVVGALAVAVMVRKNKRDSWDSEEDIEAPAPSPKFRERIHSTVPLTSPHTTDLDESAYGQEVPELEIASPSANFSVTAAV